MPSLTGPSTIAAAAGICIVALAGLAAPVAGRVWTGPETPAARVSHPAAGAGCAAWPYAPASCAEGGDPAARPARRVRLIAVDGAPAVPVPR